MTISIPLRPNLTASPSAVSLLATTPPHTPPIAGVSPSYASRRLSFASETPVTVMAVPGRSGRENRRSATPNGSPSLSNAGQGGGWWPWSTTAAVEEVEGMSVRTRSHSSLQRLMMDTAAVGKDDVVGLPSPSPSTTPGEEDEEVEVIALAAEADQVVPAKVDMSPPGGTSPTRPSAPSFTRSNPPIKGAMIASMVKRFSMLAAAASGTPPPKGVGAAAAGIGARGTGPGFNMLRTPTVSAAVVADERVEGSFSNNLSVGSSRLERNVRPIRCMFIVDGVVDDVELAVIRHGIRSVGRADTRSPTDCW
ncbi:hypothetical protein HK101_010709 [Irineochytrium annulatum]|nr:hypothetical protein HK101_010709 [Irineochytrium annulatum]